MVEISPFAPKTLAKLPALKGIEIGVGESGSRYKGRDDFVHLRICAPYRSIAGVFTRNNILGAPVQWCRARLPHSPQSIIIAAGNANVCTGNAGWQCLEDIAQAAETLYGSDPAATYVAMTGVIGEIPKTAPLIRALEQFPPQPSQALLWQQAASAIMTTDTFAKLSRHSCVIEGKTINLCGIAKGSGMIAPNMATMLAFIFTDAAIAPALLQHALNQCVADSFNAISVDGDTSTSDTVLLVSAADQESIPLNDDSLQFQTFTKALHRVCNDLALGVISDGEGIQKRLDITISGAHSREDARCAGMAIANSPLVKTAIHGQDANWGRIAMALGKSGALLNPDALRIALGDHILAWNGAAVDYDVTLVDDYLQRKIIDICVDLGVGQHSQQIWGNDLSHEYININADYRS